MQYLSDAGDEREREREMRYNGIITTTTRVDDKVRETELR